MSLIIGIFSGAMLFAGGNFLQATLTMFQVMADKVGSNVNILVFLVILGILVAAITRSGAMNAYGEWATRTIKMDNGVVIVEAGADITEEVLQKAKLGNKFIELSMSAQ